MRVFKESRAWTKVSETKFDPSVGHHLLNVSLLMAKFGMRVGWSEEKRNRMVVAALMHDLHESATGDVFPAFKNEAIKATEAWIDKLIVEQYGMPQLTVEEKTTLKFIDRLGFMWEMKRWGSGETEVKEEELIISLGEWADKLKDVEHIVANEMILEVLAGRL
jgi:hypothetical protein